MTSINTPITKENQEKAPLNAFSKKGKNFIEVLMKIETFSESNGGPKKTFTKGGKTFKKGEHWTDKHKRHKKQKGIVHYNLRPIKHVLKLPCLITLTRYGPKKLDRHDNLPMSLKWVLDACCEVITGDYRPGRADDSEEIDVVYKQVQCQDLWVKVRIDMM